jgi:hypothetical protein
LTIECLFLDVAAEKTEKALIAGIEHFDQSKLKHTETQEKNPLPNKDGELSMLTGKSNFNCIVEIFVVFDILFETVGIMTELIKLDLYQQIFQPG